MDRYSTVASIGAAADAAPASKMVELASSHQVQLEPPDVSVVVPVYRDVNLIMDEVHRPSHVLAWPVADPCAAFVFTLRFGALFHNCKPMARITHAAK